MSSSEWGSWCRACRRKRGIERAAPRYDWWMARRGELVDDNLAFKPKYGPEECFDCGGPYETGQYIYCPSVHDELKGDGEAIAIGGGVIREICSECWYADHEEPPTERIDKQKSCDLCSKELAQVIILRSEVTYDEDEDEDEEEVDIVVDLQRHVCTRQYATVHIEVPSAWADDPGYWDDEILEAALAQNYGPDWEIDDDIHSDEPAEVVDVEVI